MIALMVALALFLQLTLRLAVEPLPSALATSGALAIEDAEGTPLRELAGSDGLRARWVPLEEVPAPLLTAIVQSEDHRIALHPGADPLGVLRAVVLNVRARRVVAGGSTLAMQLARLVYGTPRTALGKIHQMAGAIALQQRLGRRGVLEAYVNLAPFGRDLRGAEAASRVYFGKPLRDVTRGEAIALACLPRSPSGYDPYRHRERLLARRASLLRLLARRGEIDGDARARLLREPLNLKAFARPFRAPHATELVRGELAKRAASGADAVRTTLDPRLQQVAELRCARAVAELAEQGASSCAAVVMSVKHAEVRALVGSPDFADPRAGQVNAAVAPRQPGSALKPFVYALAFELGKTPDTRIADEETGFEAAFGSFVPQNYDGRFHGVVTLRRALACSYNIPAVKLAAEIGPARVLERLRALGLSTLDRPAEHYGVGLALGDGEVELLALTTAYAALARGGSYLPATMIARAEFKGAPLELAPRAERRVFSPSVSRLVTDVLADPEARRPAFGAASVLELPFRAAVKTGTSSKYRDNWAFGSTDEVVVGAWIGRHDGAPMRGVSGVSGAGPLMRDLLLAARRATLSEPELSARAH